VRGLCIARELLLCLMKAARTEIKEVGRAQKVDETSSDTEPVAVYDGVVFTSLNRLLPQAVTYQILRSLHNWSYWAQPKK